MQKNVFKRIIAVSAGMAVMAAGIYMPEKAAKAAVDTSDWQKSVVIDFGVTKDLDGEGNPIPGLASSDQIQLKQALGEIETAEPVEGRGNWLYESTTVQDVYKKEAAVKQKMGFDRVVPAGITTAGGNYFKDWVFSPDGEEYSFSIDLPVGQYYVAVYTGNKTAGHDNTTFVRFNDESFKAGSADYAVTYEQTSAGGGQFYGATKTELVYVVDVKDNGEGYGTLKASFSDAALNDASHEASHKIKAGDVINASEQEEPDTKGVKSIDLYEGTDGAINGADIADKVVTARLNGIEIAPVQSPVHANKIAGTAVNAEVGYKAKIALDNGVQDITDRISYYSADPSVVSVDVYSGEAEAKAIGSTTVYAYNAYLGKAAAIEYNVIPERQVSLDKSEITLVLDDDGKASGELTATFNAASSDVIEWKTSKDDVVKIGTAQFAAGSGNSTSKVTLEALKPGSATVTAVRTDVGEKIAECTVTVVQPVKTIAITDGSGNEYAGDAVISIKSGETCNIGCIVKPEDATDKSVEYSTSDAAVASVWGDGSGAVITAAGAGEAIITVTSKYNSEIKASVKVAVTAQPEPDKGGSDSGNTSNQGGSKDSSQNVTTPPVGQNPTDGSTAPESTVKISLSGKASTKLSVKKAVTFKVKVKGSAVKKVSYKIKSGKKLVKVTASKKSVKIKAKKRGTAKVVITVKAKNGATKKFTRTIKIK
ncbi:MAG: hypothetical protein HFH14_05845 [Lachnospiraceae bacterium]|nr:hypothetical protein [Lachnospiraceae bacterium]